MNMQQARQSGAAFAVAALLALSSGCLKIDSTLDLNSDGSGKWRIIYAMPAHMIRQVQNAVNLTAALQQAGGVTNTVAEPLDLPLLFEEPAVRNRLAPLAAQGIRLVKVEVKPRAGWPTVEMTVQFDSLEKLLNQPFFADCAATYRREADGTGRLTLTAPRLGLQAKPPDLTDPKTSTAMVPFLAGLNVVSRIGVPGAIRNTNAGANDGRRATWEWDFERDGNAVERLNEARLIVIFDAAAVAMKPFEKPARPPLRAP